MALTTTSTTATKHDVFKVLGMVHPVIAALSPDKASIKHIVRANPGSLEETFALLVEELRCERTRMERTTTTNLQ